MEAAQRLPVRATRDERQPEWVRVFALRDALDTVDASERCFRCFCAACSAEDAAGVGFGEPIEP